MEVGKPMTVADLIVRLSEMDPTLEIVTPQAPYGHPTPVFHGFVTVISVDSDELAGEYCGVGFGEDDCERYCECDDLEPLDEEGEESRWHDKFVPVTADDVRKIINGIDDEDESNDDYDDDDGYDDDGGEED